MVIMAKPRKMEKINKTNAQISYSRFRHELSQLELSTVDRLTIQLIDVTIILLLCIPTFINIWTNFSMRIYALELTDILTFAGIIFVYNIVFQLFTRGTSLGGLLANIKVVSTDFTKVSLGQVLKKNRKFVFFILLFVPYVKYITLLLMVIFYFVSLYNIKTTHFHQSLSDEYAKVYHVNRKTYNKLMKKLGY